MRRVSFLKDRKWAADGGVAYPEVERITDLYSIVCDIEVELLLDSYVDALPDQIVILHFKEARSFRFFQDRTFDYCSLYKVIFHKSGENEFEFVFRTTPETDQIETLRIICPKIICTELDEEDEGRKKIDSKEGSQRAD
jgi:hypothetical protein